MNGHLARTHHQPATEHCSFGKNSMQKRMTPNKNAIRPGGHLPYFLYVGVPKRSTKLGLSVTFLLQFFWKKTPFLLHFFGEKPAVFIANSAQMYPFKYC